MSGRYERVNAHDEDDHASSLINRIPNSPPPSFHSRSSSRDRNRPTTVDPTLADAFDNADDDSDDDDADDTRRLVQPSPGYHVPTPVGSSSQQVPAMRRPPVTPGATQQQQQAVVAGSRGVAPSGRVYGGGIQSDGVFSNIVAKPERQEAEKDEQLPTYEQAAADSAPLYWETTITAPFGGPDDVYIDGMPVGSVFSFIWNGMISVSFQLIGFLLTYLLHSTHAAKNGSRAGLGVTLIQFGFYMKGTPPSSGGGSGAGGMGGSADAPDGGYASPPDPNAHDFDPTLVGSGGSAGGDSSSGYMDISGNDWIAYVLMIVGWFILIRSVSDYVRARRHEQLVLQSPDRGLGVPIVAEGESPDRVV